MVVLKSDGGMLDDRRNWWGVSLGEEDGGGVESGDVDVGELDEGSDGIVETNIE